MSTAAKGEHLPLLELPVGDRSRGLGILEVLRETGKVRLPLSKVAISAKVADRVASVTIEETFANTYSDHLEAVYIFPLSAGCAVSNFEMRVGDRVVKGKVEDRGEARRQYQQALDDGKRAALLEQDRDDVFTVQVGNLPPGEEVTVLLTYSERLPFFEDGKTELRLPLVVAPRYIPGKAVLRDSVGQGTEEDTDVVPDASRITPPRLVKGFDPEVGLKLDVELLTDDTAGGAAVSDLVCSQHATRMGMAGGNLKIELARTDERLDRDFVLQWRLVGDKVKSSVLVHRDADGSGYAMLSIFPPKREGYLGAARDLVFVLDRSGSMHGTKMVSASRACSILLSTLGPQDRFAILAFDDSSEWLVPPGNAGTKDYFQYADEAGIERGEKFLRGIDSRGGTEMDSAIADAFGAVMHRTGSEGRVPVVVILTDGEVGDESRILKRIQTQLGDARLFAVGIDTSVNDGLLRRVANLGGGTATFVQPGTQLEDALLSVGRDIGNPLVVDVKIEAAAGKLEQDTIAPARIPDLFAGRSVTAFFRINGKSKLRVKGKFSDGTVFDESVSVREVELPAISQLWAKTHITDLEDEFRINAPRQQELRARIVELAVKHSILTRFTAFVAIDEQEIVNAGGDLRQIVQPVENPAGWGMLQDQMCAPEASWGGMPQHVKAQIAAPKTLFNRAPGAPSARARAEQDSAEQGWSDQDLDEADVLLFCDHGALESQLPPPSGPPPGSPPPSPPPAPASGGGWGQLSQSANKPANKKSIGEEIGALGKMLFKGGDKQKERREGNDEIAKANTAFAEAIKHYSAEIEAGRIPLTDSLEKARQALMKALSASEAGTAVPLLQKFLRGAAVELIASLKDKNAKAAALKPLWERHLKEFEVAQKELTAVLAGTAGDGSTPFWEFTV